MNYAFLDVAHQFQLETIRDFIFRSNSKIVYLNSADDKQFHGDNDVCNSLIKTLKELNPNIEHSRTSEFLFTKHYKYFSKHKSYITKTDLLQLKAVESMAMRLMDRSSLIAVSAFSRRRLYLILLSYFDFLIRELKIESLVVFDTPHSFHSHIFYELAKYRKVNIIKLEYHFFNDYSVLLNTDVWPVIPKNFLAGKEIDEIEASLPNSLKESIYQNSRYLTFYKGNESRSVITKNVFSSLKLYVRYFDKVLKNLIMGVFPFFFKREVLHFTSINNITNKFFYRSVLSFQLLKLIRLNIFYNHIASKNVDFNEKYVFVGLHMQPEKTSQPMGGEFDNQFFMVKMLSDSVPTDWKIYVKEHPNQFNVKKVPNRHYRDKLFYEYISQLKNVRVIPLEVDSSELIKNSQMVATLTGTLGWEAITNNIPALVFGNTYYEACRLVRKIDSVESCQLAIKELGDLTKNEFKRELLRYVSYYYENNYLVRSANWQSLFQYNSLSYSEQVNNLVEGFLGFHQSNQKK